MFCRDKMKALTISPSFTHSTWSRRSTSCVGVLRVERGSGRAASPSWRRTSSICRASWRVTRSSWGRPTGTRQRPSANSPSRTTGCWSSSAGWGASVEEFFRLPHMLFDKGSLPLCRSVCRPVYIHPLLASGGTQISWSDATCSAMWGPIVPLPSASPASSELCRLIDIKV